METIKAKIITWILNSKWHQEWEKVAETRFATRMFKSAVDDVKETFVGDVEKRAEELAVRKLNDLLSNVDLTQIVTLDKTKGICYIGGERVEGSRLANLKADAEFIVQSELWKLLHETPKELAQRAMFISGETLTDLQKGKSILYILSVQKNIVDILKSFEIKK